MHIWPGSSYPLGASFDGGGTNFALFSEVADRIELCLIDDGGETRVDLPVVVKSTETVDLTLLAEGWAG